MPENENQNHLAITLLWALIAGCGIGIAAIAGKRFGDAIADLIQGKTEPEAEPKVDDDGEA